LKKQEVPMVIVSHDREFLDQLCTKIVETEGGVATTYPGNYTQYTAAKAERIAQQWSAYEKQQKEIARLVHPHFCPASLARPLHPSSR
jgi:ATPase subunit of ABC transporter with duplicated ATPase domains